MEDPLNDTGVRGLPYDQRANQRVPSDHHTTQRGPIERVISEHHRGFLQLPTRKTTLD